MQHDLTISPLKLAELTRFKTAHSPILFGEKLKDVKCLIRSIKRFGLLSPLGVVKRGDTLLVIHGKTRFAALRRMSSRGELPRNLTHIPYVILDEKKGYNMAPQYTRLLDNREHYRHVKALRKSGHSLREIATQLYLSKTCVREILAVDRLSLRLKKLYFSGHLSRSQANALATLARHDDQDDMLMTVGPFASETDILKAISEGQTVYALDPHNLIILPGQRAEPRPLMAA